jgi:DNA-binding beta-propeller fold protein YncE
LTVRGLTVSLVVARKQAGFLGVLLGISAFLGSTLRAQTSATFGEVITLGGIPADIALDQSRQRLYLVNSAANRIDVFDYAGKSLIGSIAVGNRPLGAALSVDNSFLYVANHNDSTLSVITLGSSGLGSVTVTVSLPAPPQGIETELSGRVIICTDGSGTGNAANTLLIYDPTQLSSNQIQAVVVPPPAATPPTLAPVNNRPLTTINGRLMRTPDGSHIVGVNSTNNNASTVVYVYEPASSTVLLSRTVPGQSSTLSIAADSASFMAGFTHYDLATLNVLGQQSTANAPFAMTSNFATTFNVGGSAFSPDGTTLYSAFNTAALTTPPPTPQAATLLIADPKNLAIKLGINLPESIIGRMVMTSDGNDAWALSLSGVTHLPLSTLYTYPILMPDSTTVFLAEDDCHVGVVQTSLRINNAGGGTLTFAVPSLAAANAPALEISTASGLAPSAVTFTMDPGRSAVVRIPGTNLYTGGGASNSGSIVNLQLVSPNAINVPPTIQVFMNYRDSTMRGVIYPLPTTPGSTAAANQGLEDIVLDPVRNLVYITNAGYNRIEVFDTQKMAFQTPIPVGQLPHQMSLGLDGSTLYVAETGGETIDIVDLNQQAVTGRITLPPIPRPASAAIVSVSAMAVGLSGLQFARSTGDLWSVTGGLAAPRQGTVVTGISTTGAQTAIAAPQAMVGASDGSSILLMGGTGLTYLYDGLSDAYTASHQLFQAPITGYYGPLGVAPNTSFLLSNGLVVNPSLTPIGGAATAGLTQITPPSTPGQPANSVVQSQLRNVAAVAPVNQNLFMRMTTAVRTSITTTTSDNTHTTLEQVDTRTGASSAVANMPDNPVFSLYGTARTPMPARQMVADASGTVYALTLAGLSVVPTTPVNASNQPGAASKAVLNATNGTASFSPGSFITINGTNLASSAVAQTLPPPTVLGGSCVLVDGVAIPLLSTSPTQIQAQLPATIRPGSNVLQVRSLNNAQRSSPVVVTVQN